MAKMIEIDREKSKGFPVHLGLIIVEKGNRLVPGFLALIVETLFGNRQDQVV